jgi:hypothetical protein
VSVDMIHEAPDVEGTAQLQVTLEEVDLEEAQRVCSGVVRDLGGEVAERLQGPLPEVRRAPDSLRKASLQDGGYP